MPFRKHYKTKNARPLVWDHPFEQQEKIKRAAELGLANIELAYQNEQKEKRAKELVIANKELAYQNEQKERRAQELLAVNNELAYQNEQKEKRAAELELANIELAYQNAQKEKRAQELAIANVELAYQNELKEQRAVELAEALKDLESFAYISSHHLQEPLRKIRSFVDRVLERDAANLSEKGRHDLLRIDVASARVSQLIHDVYTYSRLNLEEPVFEPVDVGALISEVLATFSDRMKELGAITSIDVSLHAILIRAQFREVIYQLVDNALKFAKQGVPPEIFITATAMTGDQADSPAAKGCDCCIEFKDNGIGFDPKFSETLFGIFQRLHSADAYPGTGIGLAIVRKIMNRQRGSVTAAAVPGSGATFRLYFPSKPYPLPAPGQSGTSRVV